jgi:hypothetical protein
MPAISLAQAEAQLAAWLDASLKVASNQSYEIDGRRLTRADAGEIRTQVDYWDRKVKSLARGGARMRTGAPG